MVCVSRISSGCLIKPSSAVKDPFNYVSKVYFNLQQDNPRSYEGKILQEKITSLSTPHYLDQAPYELHLFQHPVRFRHRGEKEHTSGDCDDVETEFHKSLVASKELEVFLLFSFICKENRKLVLGWGNITNLSITFSMNKFCLRCVFTFI